MFLDRRIPLYALPSPLHLEAKQLLAPPRTPLKQQVQGGVTRGLKIQEGKGNVLPLSYTLIAPVTIFCT